MLAQSFETAIKAFGMHELEHPLFYHAKVAIRFEIGGEEPVYQKPGKANPAYISGALTRALSIYEALPEKPYLLRIDIYPYEQTAEALTEKICRCAGLPAPHETRTGVVEDEDEQLEQVSLYWDLSQIAFQPETLILEIIRGDIGGCKEFVSSVFLLAHGPVLYHLYDDRGLDVLGGTREIIFPLYTEFNDWILDYNRARIDAVFPEKPE